MRKMPGPSGSDASDWNQSIAGIVHAIGGAAFFPRLIEALGTRVGADFPQVWYYQRGRAPCALYYAMDASDEPAHIDDYRNGGYRLDPFYISFCEQRLDSGVWRLDDLSGGVQSRGYFLDYYSALGTVDEVVFVINVDDQSALHLCLMRARQSQPFSASDMQSLREVESLVRELVLLNARCGALDPIQQAAHGLDGSIEHARRMFGSTVLTGREKSVLDLLLRGEGTRESAQKLGVAVDTLRKHRKNIYEKLGVGSQNALFGLFLDAVGTVARAPAQDPLVARLAQREQV
ncbi:response regulator transcription factor [Biformimicrobium ophioploci]|uniref:LuxR C-terminal-related transcriptional regulator n=1 Tax=Biformimicrobium ophioploci TaxID=3036711 RepID=A0ABQ6M2X7_9GAMM|nr:LuxR family transcriptional regulator [Microbulbifer sp. NKW57]GMG88667.1 LuxR C-terminal-related transcriptional regulator [Microbulbifer sp. NKW57]